MPKKVLTYCVLLFYVAQLDAQPVGYYQSALGKNGAQLKTALHFIIDQHTNVGFPLWSAFSTTDNKGANVLWDIYSDVPGGTPPYTYTIGLDQCGQYNQEGDCYNHEHLWPKTYYYDASPMDADLHHIYPVDGWVNNRRGSLPFGIVSGTATYTSSNGSKLGASNSYAAYNGAVFQPIEGYCGDIARAFFYMSTRYEGEDANWSNWPMANKAVLTNDAIALLLQWHNADPVSQKEQDRNNAIYALQGNRNPFVDYPIFANCIWGTADCTPLATENVTTARLGIFPNPASDFVQIKLPNASLSTKFRYTIFSMDGKRVLQGNTPTVDIQELLTGPYALLIEINNSREVITFLKK